MEDGKDRPENCSYIPNPFDPEDTIDLPEENISDVPKEIPNVVPCRRFRMHLPKRKTVFVGLSLLLTFVLAVSANIQAFTHTHTYTPQDILADGYLDHDYSLLNFTAEETYVDVHESVRTLVVYYAAVSDPKTVIGTANVPGVVVSDQYVMTTSGILPSQGYVIIGVLMVSSEYDRDTKVEMMVDMKAPSTKFNLVAFQRPATDTQDTPKLDVVPITLSRPDDLMGGNTLLAVPSDILLDNAVLTPAPVRGSVVYAVKGTPAIIASGIALGQPVFALRDGVPEFVGIATVVSGQDVIVTTANAMKEYLDFIGLGN